MNNHINIKVKYDKDDLVRMKRFVKRIEFITPLLKLINNINNSLGNIIIKQIQKRGYELAKEAGKNVTFSHTQVR